MNHIANQDDGEYVEKTTSPLAPGKVYQILSADDYTDKAEYETAQELYYDIATLFPPTERPHINITVVFDYNRMPQLRFNCDGIANSFSSRVEFDSRARIVDGQWITDFTSRTSLGSPPVRELVLAGLVLSQAAAIIWYLTVYAERQVNILNGHDAEAR